MQLIVSVDDKWGIGRDGKLLFRIREDMRRFRRMTLGKTVLLGRKTLETFPDGKPLADRSNIIISRSPAFIVEGALVCRSPAEVFKAVSGLDPAEVMLIGGESVYRQFLRYCRLAHVTRVEGDFGADSHLPDLDHLEGWHLADPGEPMTDGVYNYRWVTYENTCPEAYPDGNED